MLHERFWEQGTQRKGNPYLAVRISVAVAVTTEDGGAFAFASASIIAAPSLPASTVIHLLAVPTFLII